MDNARELEETGRVWSRALLRRDEIESFAALCDVGDKPGIRLDVTHDMRSFIGPGSVVARFAQSCGVDASPVRVVAFNKSSASNWAVPWHQDRVIAVQRRVDIPGYANWVLKGDVWHCEPPPELLQGMLFMRIHFDACDEENGAMEIALGSHKLGVTEARMARDTAEGHDVEVCRAAAGDVLAIKALTLHRSGSSNAGGNRRALRVDYARRRDLSPELSWALHGG